MMNSMKHLPYIILCLAALLAVPAFSQEKNPPPPQFAAPALTKFDLDFPGGSPNELVAAIEKSTGRPLNAVVPNRFASLKLPPLKMKGVDVAELFQALEAASNSHEQSPQGVFTEKFGFRTTQGTASDSSIWYFFVDGPSSLARVSRFFLLTPFLDRGLTVDDITTAIQTSWKMLGIPIPPELSFHKDTQLLIGVGDPYQLQAIDEVLRALSARTPQVSLKPDAPKTK